MHLSGEMSGTFESAQLAARESSIPVNPVDSRQVGNATASRRWRPPTSLDAGGTAEEAAARRGAGRRDDSLFSSTRWSTSAAAAGSAPPPRSSGARWRSSRCSQIDDGGWPRSRRCGPAPGPCPGSELAVAAAGDHEVDVCVAHLASPERAASSPGTSRRGWRSGLGGREIWCGELGAVLGAHVGRACWPSAWRRGPRAPGGRPRGTSTGSPRDGVVHRRPRDRLTAGGGAA